MLKAALELQLSKLPPSCLRIGSVGAGRSIDLVISGSDTRMKNILTLNINSKSTCLTTACYSHCTMKSVSLLHKTKETLSREQFAHGLRKKLPKNIPPPCPFLTVM